MKSFLWVAAILCMAASFTPAYAQVSSTYANTEIKNANGEPMLLGHCELTLLTKPAFTQWFTTGFSAYQPDSSFTTQLRPLLKDKQIEIFLGTWCGDSRREVPRMLKVLASSGYNIQQVKLIFVSNVVDAYKQSPQHEEAGKNIKRVPTLIIYHNQTEMGRIIEYPVESLEKDLLRILRQEKYTPNYSGL